MVSAGGDDKAVSLVKVTVLGEFFSFISEETDKKFVQEINNSLIQYEV